MFQFLLTEFGSVELEFLQLLFLAAPAGVGRPFQESPAELRMSSARRLLIFHAPIGTCRPVPALVWLHLSFCEIRTRFNSCSAEQKLGERLLKNALLGDDCVVCSVSVSSPRLCYVSSALSHERG